MIKLAWQKLTNDIQGLDDKPKLHDKLKRCIMTSTNWFQNSANGYKIIREAEGDTNSICSFLFFKLKYEKLV